MSNKKEKGELSGSNTLAHELVAREENNVGLFFASFAIQFYVGKDMLKESFSPPVFINNYKDMEIFASQRVLIKNILLGHNFKIVSQFIENLLKNSTPELPPQDTYLKNINKAFLIRQIFNQTDQILSRYKFIEDFAGVEISRLDMDSLAQEISHLPADQQVLVLVRIFSEMKDSFTHKKKTIGDSFLENIKRKRVELTNKGREQTSEFRNLDFLLDNLYIR